MREVARTPSYVLWKRTGFVPNNEVLKEDGAAGAVLDCSTPAGRRLAGRQGTATVLPQPVGGRAAGRAVASPVDAPAAATQRLQLSPGTWTLSLQYHSQATLTVTGPGGSAKLPPSLVGMYLTDFVPGHPQDSFWPAGRIEVSSAGPTEIRVEAEA